MQTIEHPIEQLEQLANEFHHWSEEYKRENQQGSTRRGIEKRLQEMDDRFNSLLDHWVSNEQKRHAWHEHLHRNAPQPEDDLAKYPPVYIGQSTTGSEIQVRPAHEGGYDILIDGLHADRIAGQMRFPANMPVHLLDQEWKESTNTHSAALEALRKYCERGNKHIAPPWEWARVLYGDGLIDVNFGLTERGRRVLGGD